MRTFRSCAQLMAAAAVGVMAVSAMAKSPDTSAGAISDEAITEERGQLTLMMQSFDGVVERSLTQSAGVGRLTRGEQTWTEVDYGNGAAVGKLDTNIVAGNFRNDSPAEIGVAWNNGWRVMSGNDDLDALYNGPINAFLASAPASVSQVEQIEFSPADLGIASTGGSGKLTLFRDFEQTDAGKYTIVRFDVPSFAYAADGERIVQWSKGAALTDAENGRVLWFTSLHRAVATPSGGVGRPMRYAYTVFATDEQGKPLIDPQRMKTMLPRLFAVYGEEATAPLPSVDGPLPAMAQAPIELAARLDLATLARIEGTAGPTGIATAGFIFGNTGNNVPIPGSIPMGEEK